MMSDPSQHTNEAILRRVHVADYVPYSGNDLTGSGCCDGDLGMMALWTMLNLSAYVPAQVSICK